MRNDLIILQAFGLGDCIFAQGVARKFIEEGYNVIWPVKPQFIDGLRHAYPLVIWIPDTIVKPELFDIKEDKIVDGIRIFPMRWADRLTNQDAKYWMRAKFDLAGMDWTKWKEGAMWKREYSREARLFYDEYKIERGEKYNLISNTFKTDASGKIDIVVDNGLRNVEMKFVDGYSLFDHSILIERAENIHAVNSAIFYLLELLELSAKQIHLYQRTGLEIGFPYVDYLFSKNYILHQ